MMKNNMIGKMDRIRKIDLQSTRQNQSLKLINQSMEITSVDTICSIKKNTLKECVQAPCLEDKLTISSEAKKRAEWLEMVKAMPDIRPDRIECCSEASSHQILAVAHAIIESGF
jgi:hypothetical protein